MQQIATSFARRDVPVPCPVGRRVCAAQAFWPKDKTLAQGQFTCPEQLKYRRVELPSGQRNPKRRTRHSRVLLFGDPSGNSTRGLKKLPPAGFLRPAGRRPVRIQTFMPKKGIPTRGCLFLVTRRGFEPRTHCLKGSCSAD